MSVHKERVSIGVAEYLQQIVILLRPKHWVKNLFLFLPLFFSGELFSFTKVMNITRGAFAFCLVASAIYILNDFRDIHKDRLHPDKRNRPLASGRISTRIAFLMMSLCLIAGFLVAWFSRDKFVFVLSLYLLINVGYSLGLKNISILDIFIVASGFILRVKGGGAIAMVGISQWLMIMVFLLALFMALGKRRDDVLIRVASGKEMRKSIAGYNPEFLNISLAIVSAIIIVAYLMYTLDPEVMRHMGTYRLYYTGVFVVAGLMRYLQLVYVQKDSGSPTKILYKDHFIQICIILWILSFYLIIYYPDLRFFE